MKPTATGDEIELAQTQGCPLRLAEQAVSAARDRGDRRRQITALVDLGLIHVHERSAQQAVPLMEEALSLVETLDDRAAEADVLANLGYALLMSGQPGRAVPVLDRALVRARQTGDRYAEAAALERQGLAHARLRERAQAVLLLEQALVLARDLGDPKRQADLLWHLAIQHAELARHDRALASAQAAVDVLVNAGYPEAAWYAAHLRKYRAGGSLGGLGRAASPRSSTFSTATAAAPVSMAVAAPGARTGPGLLRMALNAAKSMAQFLGSRLKTTPPATLQLRLRTCLACEHHTGLRCRLCGCFTNAKARMAHEDCPVGKWLPVQHGTLPPPGLPRWSTGS
jgi:tetratricopeptide (TPR) repeat protein